MKQLHRGECRARVCKCRHRQAASYVHLIAGVHPAGQSPLGRRLPCSARQLSLGGIPHSRDDGAPAAMNSAQAVSSELSEMSCARPQGTPNGTGMMPWQESSRACRMINHSAPAMLCHVGRQAGGEAHGGQHSRLQLALPDGGVACERGIGALVSKAWQEGGGGAARTERGLLISTTDGSGV